MGREGPGLPVGSGTHSQCSWEAVKGRLKGFVQSSFQGGFPYIASIGRRTSFITEVLWQHLGGWNGGCRGSRQGGRMRGPLQ